MKGARWCPWHPGGAEHRTLNDLQEPRRGAMWPIWSLQSHWRQTSAPRSCQVNLAEAALQLHATPRPSLRRNAVRRSPGDTGKYITEAPASGKSHWPLALWSQATTGRRRAATPCASPRPRPARTPRASPWSSRIGHRGRNRKQLHDRRRARRWCSSSPTPTL